MNIRIFVFYLIFSNAFRLSPNKDKTTERNKRKKKVKNMSFYRSKIVFFDNLCFFYQPSLLIIMLTPLMAYFTEKRFEVSQCLGPIQIQPHEAVLRSVKARSEMSLPFIVI